MCRLWSRLISTLKPKKDFRVKWTDSRYEHLFILYCSNQCVIIITPNAHNMQGELQAAQKSLGSTRGEKVAVEKQKQDAGRQIKVLQVLWSVHKCCALDWCPCVRSCDLQVYLSYISMYD